MSMTWGEFKRAMEAEGVGDHEEIFYIDTHLPHDTLDVGYVDGLGVTVTCF